MKKRWYAPQDAPDDPGAMDGMFRTFNGGKQSTTDGRIHSSVTSSTNRPQKDYRVVALEETSKILSNASPNKAQVKSGFVGDKYVDYTFDTPHGFENGRADGLNVQRLDSHTIRISK